MGVSSCRKNRKNKNYSFGKNLSKMKGGGGERTTIRKRTEQLKPTITQKVSFQALKINYFEFFMPNKLLK